MKRTALLVLTMGAALLAPAGQAGADTPADPRARASQPITAATLTWGLSGYAQKGVFGPWVVSKPTGAASVLAGSVSGGSQTGYVAEPLPTTSLPVSSPQTTPNAVRFGGGTGTADPATGAATLSWTGSYTVNAYPAQYGAPDETYADPQLTVDAAGVGTLSMQLTLGAGQDIDGNPTPATDVGRVTVLTFATGSDAATAGSDRTRYTPAYQGVRVTVPSGTAQQTCSGTWGSWPQAFVSAVPESIRPHFYSTGCGGLQENKPPLPVDVDLGLSSETTPSVAVSATADPATVTVRVAGATGAVTLRSGVVQLGTADLVDGVATYELSQVPSGRYPLAAYYAGDPGHARAVGLGTLVVDAAASRTTLEVTQAPTARKAGRGVVTVASSSTPTGAVQVALTKGGTRLLARGTLRSGRATVTLPTLARGTWQLVATYGGSARVASSSSKATKLTVR